MKYNRPTSQQATEGGTVKNCLNCGKKFTARLSYHNCCSWECTVQHKAKLTAQVEADREPSEYPF